MRVLSRTSRGARGGLFVAALLATISIGSAAFGQQGSDEADAFFRQGNEFYTASRFPEAEAAYRKAWALKKTHDIAANLGHATIRLGKYRDAAEFLDFALRNHPPTGAADKREFIRKSLEEARKHVGSIRVTVNQPGSDVLVDGVLIGNTPLDAELFVEPGSRKIEARLAHYRDAARVLEVTAGGATSVQLELAPEGPGSTPPPVRPKSVPLIIAGYGVALVGIGLGAAFIGVATGKRGDRTTLQNELTASGAVCPAGQQCAQLKSTLGQVDTFTTASIVGFSVGGAAAIATTIYVLLPSKSSSSEQGWRIEPVVGRTNGMTIRAHF